MSRIEGADISIEDFLEENEGLSQSNLQKSFEKTSVLLTGVTSFIGSVVLEKLLRSCPGIDCVYVLIRNKNGKEPVERMKELFRSLLFDRLKMEYPQTMNKVHVIPCDFMESDLGISNDDYLMITSKVSAIIHTARLIGSSVKLKESILINIKALYSLLKLCQEIKILDGFAYVSSLYAHFNETIIEEKLYPCSLTGDGLINMVDNLSENTLENITTGITGEYPNISTLTIAVAERILHEEGEGLPICIIRPSFVLPSCNEPIAGWIQPQRIESPSDILLNVFLGKIFSINCDGRKPAEAVPVDKVANLIIAATGSLLLKRKEWINQAVIISNSFKKTVPTVADFQDIQIYNMVLSNKQKLTWSEFFAKSIEHVEEVPFLDAELRTNKKEIIWCLPQKLDIRFMMSATCFRPQRQVWNSSLQMNRYRLVHWLITWLQLGKIILFDQIKGGLGINYDLLKEVKRHQISAEKIQYFIKRHWHLKDDNVNKLWDAISDSDRSHFDFNLKSLDWNHFFDTQCRGLRVYSLQDPLSTVNEARNNQKWMKNVYNLLWFLLVSCTLIIIYKFWL